MRKPVPFTNSTGAPAPDNTNILLRAILSGCSHELVDLQGPIFYGSLVWMKGQFNAITQNRCDRGPQRSRVEGIA